MKCPRCRQPDLELIRREGIEIDRCPQCRGVWLDHGEIEKVINHTLSAESAGDRAGSDRVQGQPEPKPLTMRNFLKALFDS